ncbi:MAG: glutamate--cysteine ligase [Deltaproteobacteria bacterium]|nr:glutamate--cysteine ligase [Deltaproteobacteria bacterium]
MVQPPDKRAAGADNERALTYEELFEPFRKSFKPAAKWAIGVESERFGVREINGEPLRYAGAGGVTEVLDILENRFGWSPESEVPGGPVILLNRGRSQITLEPGGQVELSGAPHPDIHHVHEETRLHLSELGRLSECMGIQWMSIGFHPLAHQEELDWVPKLRYGVMREYLATRGKHAHDMMRRTGTVQVNFDYSDEQDALRKLRVSLRLSPVVAAMFANSPFVEGHVFGGRSLRQLVWHHVDPDRQGLLPKMWDPRTTIRDYIEWALDVPMFLVKRPGQIVRNTGQTFRSYLSDGFQGTRATMSDWTTHLNTLFPEVRLKNTLEMRGADAQPFEVMCALPALWTGIVYDDLALEQAERLTADWSFERMERVRGDAIMQGLSTPFLGKTLAHAAEQVMTVARDGLVRRARRSESTGEDETKYLDEIAPLLAHGQTPADRLVAGLEDRIGSLRDEILRRVGP